MSICSSPSSRNLVHRPFILSLQIIRPNAFIQLNRKLPSFPSPFVLQRSRLCSVAEDTELSSTLDPSSEVARRLYVGNIPRNVENADLTRMVEEPGSVEKTDCGIDFSRPRHTLEGVADLPVEDANAAIEKLNCTQIGGREVKVNITEKPTSDIDRLAPPPGRGISICRQPPQCLIGNLAKTLLQFFSEKGKFLSTKVWRVPGTSKSSGFGFVSFSSDEDVDAAISLPFTFNNGVSCSLLVLSRAFPTLTIPIRSLPFTFFACNCWKGRRFE
ncbi:hypothetical protein SAY87_009740 [Trapa incisa]|uniref:RRM domain-containing protein n=1 Tax=Trapa incisa TaxID=236973 RepID=A0AAN7JW46_9MYRT|nr:hypothetical protein SAY87_009740 [Trapa incisa]